MKKISLPFNFKSSNLKTSHLSAEEKAKIVSENESLASSLSISEVKTSSKNEKSESAAGKNQVDRQKNGNALEKNQTAEQKDEQISRENNNFKTLSREEQLILSAKQISPGGNPKLFGEN